MSGEQVPLWQQAYSDVLTAVVDPEIARLLDRPVTKDQALLALAARRELIDRLRRYWLAIETARAAGASWPEIDAALRVKAGRSRRLYEASLARQKAFGLVDESRGDPGPPEPPASQSR